MPADRKWRPWTELSSLVCKNKCRGTSELITQLASNTLANYADSRRWQATQILNYPNTGAALSGYNRQIFMRVGETRTFLSLNARDLLKTSGKKLRAVIRCINDIDAYDMYISLIAKQYQAAGTRAYGSTGNYSYVPIDLDIEQAHMLDNTEDPSMISLAYINEAAEHYASIVALAIHECEDPAVVRHTDLTGGTVGNDDLPITPYVLELLRNNDAAIRNRRTTHTQMSKWFGYQKAVSSASYDYSGKHGTWPMIKTNGMASLTAKARYKMTGSAGDDSEFVIRAYPLWVLDFDGQTANFVTDEWIYGATSGARAKILKQIDHGTTGHLFLSHMTGEFANNEAIAGSKGGAAVADGQPRDPVATEYIAEATQAVTYVAGDWNWTDPFTLTGDLLTAESELEIRLDSKYTGGTPSVVVSNLWMSETLAGAAEVAHVLPILTDSQTDDDVLAAGINNIRTTQQQVWDRSRKTVINDEQHATPEVDSGSEVVLTRGVLFPSHRAQYLTMRATVEKTNRESSGRLYYSGMAGTPFVAGEALHQQIYNGTAWVTTATATIAEDDATNDVLLLENIQGTFKGNNGVAITHHRIYGITSTGSATVDSDQESVDPDDIRTTVKLILIKDLSAITYASTAIQSHEVEITQMNAAQGPFDVTMRVRIPTTWFNSYSNEGTMPGPVVFALLAQSTINGVVSTYERVKLLAAVTYEEPQTSLKD
jgi:hypothetical protein